VTAAPELFGSTRDGHEVHVHTLGHEPGVVLRVLDLGAAVHELWAPDAAGRRADVVLGAPDVAGYEKTPSDYYGAVVGRCANRVTGAVATIDGRTHDLLANDGENTLHGGPDGFQARLWDVAHADEHEIVLRLVSPAGDQGLPGELSVEVRYRVEASQVTFEWSATTTATTLANLTQHTHFNLAGESSGSIDGHLLRVAAEAFTPAGEDLAPTGEVAPVTGTALDLRQARRLGDVRPLDHNFVLSGAEPAAVLTDPASGRVLELFTDRPGLQVYTGNFFDGTQVGTGGVAYDVAAGVALEPQVWPDAVHHQDDPDWPSPLLEPGRTLRSTTRWRFSAQA
jgi:aldose 1-epimerase